MAQASNSNKQREVNMDWIVAHCTAIRRTVTPSSRFHPAGNNGGDAKFLLREAVVEQVPLARKNIDIPA
jgi:hypothetical protein